MRALVEGQANGELPTNGEETAAALAEGELVPGANGSDGFEAEDQIERQASGEVSTVVEPSTPKPPAPEAD